MTDAPRPLRRERPSSSAAGGTGISPSTATELFIPFLRANGFDVRVEESPAVYADAEVMAATDLIVQSNTMASIEAEEFAGLRAAVENGTGLAGWHGGIADSYRNTSDYLQLIGGQFASHPGKTRWSARASNPTITCPTRSR